MSENEPENMGLFDDGAAELQAPLQAAAPIAPVRTSRLKVCRKCTHENAPGEQACRKCGAFLPGNETRLVHGRRRRPGFELPAEVREALELKRRLIADDLGGEASLSQLQRDVLERYTNLDALASFQAGELARGGMLTASGKTRALFSAFLATVDKQVKLAQLLGLERREKAVPSMAEYLALLEAREAARTAQDGPPHDFTEPHEHQGSDTPEASGGAPAGETRET